MIYSVSCKKCRLQYIGSTNTDFQIRFHNHKSAMLTNKTTCEVAVHFKKTPHILDDFSFQCSDQVQAPNNSDEIDRLLVTKEAYWSAQLFSLAAHGLNKRKEFHSRNRICYNLFSFLRFFVRDIWPFKGPFLGFCQPLRCWVYSKALSGELITLFKGPPGILLSIGPLGLQRPRFGILL